MSCGLPELTQGSTRLMRQARPLRRHGIPVCQQLQITQVTSGNMQRVARAKAPARSTKRTRQADRRLVVKALARTQIDVHKLARAYINLAYDLAKQRRAEHDDQDRSRS